jgi:hypothetical protein
MAKEFRPRPRSGEKAHWWYATDELTNASTKGTSQNRITVTQNRSKESSFWIDSAGQHHLRTISNARASQPKGSKRRVSKSDSSDSKESGLHEGPSFFQLVGAASKLQVKWIEPFQRNLVSNPSVAHCAVVTPPKPSLTLPAVVVVLCGIVHILSGLFTCAIVLLQRAILSSMNSFEKPFLSSLDKPTEQIHEVFNATHLLFGALCVALLVVGLFSVVSGSWLSARRHYQRCVLAAVLGVPAFGLGLFVLIVLLQPEVRASFERQGTD